ncbi:CRP-like cAMP-binding protein [Rhodopseudomonas rhenobacensis]|uniref:CRP-like cAMP-binding protein n=1 Tax=Rhodopseudomonas rhenobacensis TaxID=87461 RepID=A0A7W7Z4L2_9BRAD|nr:Crp/Fnr family transcriptional regulator [Rhodopseudomonas rhenobacensis]MBB5047911.1 CRP-like cAMP-binding protein [Rhodopseudomonas rhenobacensis]
MIQSRRNRLLEMLPRHDLNQLRPHLHSVVLDYKMPLYEAFEPIHDVYFPLDGVASLVATMADGSAAEIGTIGNEGIVGTPIILGDTIAPTNVYVQVPGHALKLKAEVLRQALLESAATRTLMLHYVHAFFNQVAQSAVCNHFHSIEQRCCRWLLMTHDRMHEDHFLLTQEFLAMMLGARRSSVTEAAKRLKQLQLISYVRGHVTILDRAGIERTSCECYAVSKAEYDRLLGTPEGLDAKPAPANV